MKFYLTKAAQRAAESGSTITKTPKAAKPERVSPGMPVRAERPARMENSARAEETTGSGKPQRGSKAATASASSASVAAPGYGSAPAPSSSSAPAQDAPTVATRRPAAVVTPLVESTDLLEAPGKGRAAKAAKAAATKRPSSKIIAIGGEARVDLLPAEVRADRRTGVFVRRAWLGVAALVVSAVIATGAATLYAQRANDSLAASQGQTADLSVQAAKYSSVKTVEGQVALIKAARLVGGSTDIDWPEYLTKVQATLPSGMTLSTVAIDSASPVTAYLQASGPLEGQRVATLTFSATSSSLPTVPDWLDNLQSLKGYTDASADSVSQSDGVYTAKVTVHLNQKAFSGAYAKKGK